MRCRTMKAICVLLAAFIGATNALKVIDNGLALPEIVHEEVEVKPRCVVKAPPLDLMFILDSSGSLKNKFQDEVDVIRRIIAHVTIGESATRVALVQYSGIQRLEFNFLKFTDRDQINEVLGVLRHVSGITRTGAAFEFAIKQLTAANGMRDASVPKVVFLLSDGRTADFPKDLQFSAAMRKAVPNLNIWAYGTGDYVAIEQLVNMTLSYDKIVTNQNLTKLEPMFDGYRGIEICEKAPVCVKGSDKPLDLMLIIDASESVEDLFQEQITFAIERVVQNININPEAVRLALITYSGKSTINFKFNDPRFSNNSAVIRHLNNVKAIKGTTQTPLALNDAVELFMDRDGTSGVRKGVKRVAIVITDGHSARSPRAMASRLQNENVTVFAVSQTPNPTVDESELLVIARDKSRVFTPRNLQSFETEFLQYIGFGCPGLKLGPNSKPSIRGATDVSCTPNSLTVTIRTQKPMNGLIYAQQYSEDSKCVQVASNEKRETTLTLLEGTCGLQKTPSVNGDGYNWNVTVMLQFHPLVITKVDQGLDINCFTPARVSQAEIGRSTIKKPGDTQCSYRIHRYGPEECAALDAQVGDNLFHKWECDNPPNYQFLVHDCEVTSTIKTAPFIDSNGCTIDPFILETPDYSRLVTPRKGDAYVFQEMSAFKFPNQGDIQFRCKISLCDMESGAECTKMIAPKCGDKRPQRSIEPSKAGFAATLNVETKRINVLENERIKPPVPVKYCDIRLRK